MLWTPLCTYKCDSSHFIVKMAEDWEAAPAVAETPEIKLFGKWSTDDVQINDISLQVCLTLTQLDIHMTWFCKHGIFVFYLSLTLRNHILDKKAFLFSVVHKAFMAHSIISEIMEITLKDE